MRHALLVVLFLGLAISAHAQESSFSQFYASRLHLNPALAADRLRPSLELNQRSNLNRDFFPHSLSQVTGSLPIRLRRYQGARYAQGGYVGGIGLSIFDERTGPNAELNVQGALLALAYRSRLTAFQTLCLGMQLGIQARRIDYGLLRWGSQYDAQQGYLPQAPSPSALLAQQVLVPIANAGFYWKYDAGGLSGSNERFQAFLGLAGHALNRPDVAFWEGQSLRRPVLLKAHGGLALPLSRRLALLPNFLYMRQGKEQQWNAGAHVSTTLQGARPMRLQMGGWYRPGDAAILSAGIQLADLSLGLSYDFNQRNLRFNNQGQGAAEIHLAWNLGSGSLPSNPGHPLF